MQCFLEAVSCSGTDIDGITRKWGDQIWFSEEKNQDERKKEGAGDDRDGAHRGHLEEEGLGGGSTESEKEKQGGSLLLCMRGRSPSGGGSTGRGKTWQR